MSPWLIFGLILVVSGIAGIFTLAYKKIPTLLNLPTDSPESGIFGGKINLKNELKKKLETIKYFSYQPRVLQWLEKILRKIRVLILKADNLFIAWIGRARNESQVWTIRSRAWMEHRRLKKKEKTQMLENLDKVEIFQELEKMKQEVAKEEDAALKEKIENVSGNGTAKSEESVEAVQPLENRSLEEEKRCIDLITQNPKDLEAYRILGFIYLNQKNYSDARACFRQILKLEPEDQEVKRKLEEINGLKSKNGAEEAGGVKK